MQHADHKEKVTAEFNRLYSEAPVKEHLNLRGKVARDLLKKEPASVQGEMKTGAEKAHNMQRAKYEAALDGVPSLDAEAQAQYIPANFAY